jgi:hypothetical protein
MDPLQLWLDSSQRRNVFDIPHSHTEHIRKLQGTAGTLSTVCQNRGLQSLATHEDHEDTGEAVGERVTALTSYCFKLQRHVSSTSSESPAVSGSPSRHNTYHILSLDYVSLFLFLVPHFFILPL